MSRGSLARLGLLACIWGSSFLWIELALRGLSPVQVVLGRLLAATAVLGPIVLVQRRRLPRAPSMWGHLLLLALVANIIPFTLFGFGQQRITSGLAGVLNGTTPLFTLMFAVATLPEERLTLARGAGLAIGFCGVVLIVGPWDANPLTSSVPGQLACLGAAACYGVAFTYTRRFVSHRGYPPIVLSAVQLGSAALLLGAAMPVVGRDEMALDVTVAGSIVMLGALGTGAAYLLFHRLVAEAGATSASMVTYMVPVVAVLLGVAVLGEPLTWNTFAGAVVVIAGVATAEGRLPGLSRRAPPTPPEAAAGLPEEPDGEDPGARRS